MIICEDVIDFIVGTTQGLVAMVGNDVRHCDVRTIKKASMFGSGLTVPLTVTSSNRYNLSVET